MTPTQEKAFMKGENTMRILMKKSSCADTRTCDWSKVTVEQLLEATHSHKRDVANLLVEVAHQILQRAADHDFTKVSEIKMFHKDFSCGFATQDWYAMHKTTERHHLEADDGVREDVNIVDLVECICDGVAAGMARSGKARETLIKETVLTKAVNNTIEMLSGIITVVE